MTVRKVVLSLLVVIAFIVSSIYERQEFSLIPVITPRTSDSNTGVPSTPTPSQSDGKRYRDGSYTGDRVDAFYGYIQVRATIQGGSLRDIEFLEYPSDRRTSEMINTQAIPIWTQEAIQKQNAEVDIVTGATDSSIAFRESLASALTQAGN